MAAVRATKTPFAPKKFVFDATNMATTTQDTRKLMLQAMAINPVVLNLIEEIMLNHPTFFDAPGLANSLVYRTALLSMAHDSESTRAIMVMALLSGLVRTKSRVVSAIEGIPGFLEKEKTVAYINKHFKEFNNKKDGMTPTTVQNVALAFPDLGLIGMMIHYKFDLSIDVKVQQYSWTLDPDTGKMTKGAGSNFTNIPAIFAYPNFAQINLHPTIQLLHEEWEKFYWVDIVKLNKKDHSAAVAQNEYMPEWYKTKKADIYNPVAPDWAMRFINVSNPWTMDDFRALCILWARHVENIAPGFATAVADMKLDDEKTAEGELYSYEKSLLALTAEAASSTWRTDEVTHRQMMADASREINTLQIKLRGYKPP